jgi:hypothetical protein
MTSSTRPALLGAGCGDGGVRARVYSDGCGCADTGKCLPTTALSDLPRRGGPGFPIGGLSVGSHGYDGPPRCYSPSAVSLAIGSHAHT